MRTPRPALALLLSVLIPASLSAQQSTGPAPTPVASDPQAVALLLKSLAAMTGGIAVTDVTLTGSARRIAGSDDETGTATLKATSLGDSRVDLSFPSGERMEIRNHSTLPLPGSVPTGAPGAASSTPQAVGAFSGPDGAVHPIAGHNLLTDPAWFLPAMTIARLAGSPNYIVSYIGPETHDGEAVLHLSAIQQFQELSTAPAQFIAALRHLSQMDVYLDSSSLLLTAITFNVHPDKDAGIDIASEVRFSDFRAVNGIQVPFHVQRYLNNGLVLDLQFSDVTLNSGLAATAFNPQ